MVVHIVDNFAAPYVLLGETHLEPVDGFYRNLSIGVDGWPPLNTSVDNAQGCATVVFKL